MTSLPLIWSEGGIEADLAKDVAPHPAFKRLSAHYDITPIDDLEAWGPKPKHMLLLAQPRAFAPRELVRLDNWVRQGGLVLILADPALQWGSLYPLGDKRRPLFTSMLSPLFAHWGLELVLPLEDEVPASMRKIGVFPIRTVTAGEWLPKQSTAKGRCAILAKGLLADCRIGKGRAVLVADADFLDAAFWEGQGMRILTGKDEFANMALLQALLTALQDDKGLSGDFVGK
ncbi:ABC transporter [Sphingorhabdus sp. EL138]|uniref:Gldg family protein n=1 Tax=Sphingorhabdus sp. EL138 TaxID=2073156 RepID=UPI0025E7F403|nr:ABC transporter [Sphingorhabdus sp. EL138]